MASMGALVMQSALCQHFMTDCREVYSALDFMTGGEEASELCCRCSTLTIQQWASTLRATRTTVHRDCGTLIGGLRLQRRLQYCCCRSLGGETRAHRPAQWTTQHESSEWLELYYMNVIVIMTNELPLPT